MKRFPAAVEETGTQCSIWDLFFVRSWSLPPLTQNTPMAPFIKLLRHIPFLWLFWCEHWQVCEGLRCSGGVFKPIITHGPLRGHCVILIRCRGQWSAVAGRRKLTTFNIIPLPSKTSQMCLFAPLVPAFGKERQEDCSKFETSSVHVASSKYLGLHSKTSL